MPQHARRRRITARADDATVPEPTKQPIADHVLALQRSAGNQAVVGAIQREKDPHLLSMDKMGDVFGSIFNSILAARGHPRSHMHRNLAYKAALKRLKLQVGDLNYSRFMATGVPESIPTEEELDREEAEEAQAGLEEHYAAERKLVASLQASASRLSRAVAQVEHLAHRLKSPEGAKGVIADYLGGFLGAAATVGIGVKDAVDEVGKFTKPVTDTGGWLADQAVDAASQKPSGPTAEQKLEKFTTNLETADQLMKGELHLIWKETRPSYKRFQAARARFEAGERAWSRAGNDVEAGMAVGEMRDGLKAMAQAARAFYDVCARHDLMTKAANLSALNKAIDQGIGLAVSTAVDFMAGKLTEGVDKIAKDKLKEQVRPSLEKATEVAYNKMKGAPKKAVEIATQ